MLLLIGSILSGKSIIRDIVGLATLTYVLYFTNKIEGTYNSDGTLTGGEKASVIITAFLSPIIAQSFYYYCWKSRFPNRAAQANKYGWMALGFEILIVVVIFLFTAGAILKAHK